MNEDIFFELKSNLQEFTDRIYLDYERESVLLEARKDYLDELMKILRGSYLELDIVFVKELVPEICTIIACVPQIIDIYNDIGNDDGGYAD
jgi:hypothetical protein